MVVSTFPEKLKNVNDTIASIQIMEDNANLKGNAIVLAFLKNGETYSFNARTPENIRTVMVSEGLMSFISPGLVIVDSVSVDSILNALEEILVNSRGLPGRIGEYGILQK